MTSGATLRSGNPLAEPTGARSGYFASPEHPYPAFRRAISSPIHWGPLLCLLGKSPTKEEGRTLWATTHKEEDHNEP